MVSGIELTKNNFRVVLSIFILYRCDIMDKYENMDTSDEKISKYREILKQAHQKGILDNE